MIYFAPHAVGTDACAAYFEALDGEACLGVCRLRLDGNRADVFELSLTDGDAGIGEGLLRAAYHFAANKGAYWGVCSAEADKAVTARLRFESRNGVLENDIPTLLTGTCGGFDKTP